MRVIAAVCCILLAAGVAAHGAAESIGLVIALDGSVTATAADGKSRDLALKAPIFQNDKIVSAGSSKIQIMFNDDTVVSQGENSEMTIDEYVYDPANAKQSGASMKLVKGLFRSVTGKITKLNPDRFKVKTRMATIGIRGCDIAYRLQQQQEDVYVIYLPENTSIVFEETHIPGEAVNQLQNDNIVQHGVIVSLRAGSGAGRHAMSMGEARLIMNQTTPGSQKGDGDDALIDDDARDTAGEKEKRDQANKHAVLLETAAGKEPPPVEHDDSVPHTSDPTMPPPDDVLGGPPPPDPFATEWEVALWDSGYVEYYPNRATGNSFLTVGDFTSIRDNTASYALSGSGQIGASLQYIPTAYQATIYGSCMLNVNIGNGVANWNGSFSAMDFMSGDTLDFVVGTGNGTFDANGRMQVNGLSSYTLIVDRHSYGPPAPADRSLDGQLIQNSSGTPPPIGAAGEFHFSHNAGEARADGGFGADF